MPPTQFLKPGDNVEIKTQTSIDPSTYFKNRDDLWVSSGFTDKILPDAKEVDTGADFKIKPWKLVQDAADEQIEDVLGDAHIFDVSTLCAVIANLIDQQSKGKEGTLLNNGYSNLFYTEKCVVYVYWSADHGEWRVRAWLRHDYEWIEGDRIFSPVN